ncbi:hypothetical protein DFH06DRAFT_266487 [Mycena polygramma]|nr:hypothetical protein DFH06DRAFT_266487 [Mycena polygramma]
MVPCGRRRPCRGDTHFSPGFRLRPHAHLTGAPRSVWLSFFPLSPSLFWSLYIISSPHSLRWSLVGGGDCLWFSVWCSRRRQSARNARVPHCAGVVEAAVPSLPSITPSLGSSSPSLISPRTHIHNSCTSTRHQNSFSWSSPRQIHSCTVYHQADTLIRHIATRTIATHPPSANAPY